MQLDLTELSSYLPLVPCFEFGNASGTLFPCTEGRVRTIMTSAGTPRAGAFCAVCVSLVRVVIICLASTHTALVSQSLVGLCFAFPSINQSSLELDEVLSHRQVVVPVDAAVGKGRVRARAVGDVEPAHVAILVDRVEEAGRAVVVRACPQLHA